MAGPVEETGGDEAGADLVLGQGPRPRGSGVIGVPSPLRPGGGRVAREVDGRPGGHRNRRRPEVRARVVSQHVACQRNELARVQLGEIAYLLPKQPVGGARGSEVEEPVVGDLGPPSETVHCLEVDDVLRGARKGGMRLDVEGQERVAPDQPLAIGIGRGCDAHGATELALDLRPAKQPACEPRGLVTEGAVARGANGSPLSASWWSLPSSSSRRCSSSRGWS